MGTPAPPEPCTGRQVGNPYPEPIPGTRRRNRPPEPV